MLGLGAVGFKVPLFCLCIRYFLRTSAALLVAWLSAASSGGIASRQGWPGSPVAGAASLLLDEVLLQGLGAIDFSFNRWPGKSPGWDPVERTIKNPAAGLDAGADADAGAGASAGAAGPVEEAGAESEPDGPGVDLVVSPGTGPCEDPGVDSVVDILEDPVAGPGKDPGVDLVASTGSGSAEEIGVDSGAGGFRTIKPGVGNVLGTWACSWPGPGFKSHWRNTF